MTPTTPTTHAGALLANDLRRGVGRLVATLRATPVDKLDFKPSDTAKSIREMAQHTLGGNGYCLQAVGLPEAGNPAETDLEKLIADLEATTETLAAYADKADDALLANEIQFFGQSLVVAPFLQTVEWHISRHAAQIDYVQTIYGDLEDHG